MSTIYYFNDAGNCNSRTVTLSQTSCQLAESYTDRNGQYYQIWRQNLTFSLNTAASADIVVYYNYDYHFQSDFGDNFQETYQDSVTILAGQTSKTISFDCYYESFNDFGSGGWVHEYTWKENVVLAEQFDIPAVCANLPANPLEITSHTLTNPVKRGDTNGSIAITLSGATGTTVTYKLNGVIKTSSGNKTNYTYSNLGAGLYYVTVIDGSWIAQAQYTLLEGEFQTGAFNTSGNGVKYNDPVLVAVDSPIIARVNTAINNPNPKANITTFSIDDDLADGYHLTFNLTSPFIYSNSFYAKGFPNKPQYFLAYELRNSGGIQVGTNSRQDVATSLAEALQKDAVISKIYFINCTDVVVTLTAKETGSKFNLNSSNVLALNASNVVTSGITITQTQAGVDYCDGQIVDNYSIGCEVMVNTDTTNQYPLTGELEDYNRVAELVLPFNQNNIHTFDISNILKSQVSTPFPSISLTGSTILPTVMQPYYLRFFEYYPLVANTNTVKKKFKYETAQKWAINSSLDRYDANDMDEYLGILSNINANFSLILQYTGGAGTAQFVDALFDTGYTGTTNVKYSIWNSTNNAIVKAWQTSPNFSAIAAGNYYARVSGVTSSIKTMYSRSFFLNAYGSGQDGNYYSTWSSGVKFLTNSPNPKQILRTSNEFLYFIIERNYGKTLKVKGNIYHYDGSVDTNVTFFTITTSATNAGGCMVMNISYDKLGLAAYELTSKIKRVVIGIYQSDALNNDWLYSDTKTYRFDIDEQSKNFSIIFQNSLGMYDSFDFIGIIEETLDRTSDTYTMPLNYNVNGSISSGTKNTSTYNTKVTKKVVVNTGWIDEAHFNWLQELLKSNNIYNSDTLDQNYLNLNEFSYIKSSLDDLYSAEFTFTWTIFENNVSV